MPNVLWFPSLKHVPVMFPWCFHLITYNILKIRRMSDMRIINWWFLSFEFLWFFWVTDVTGVCDFRYYLSLLVSFGIFFHLSWQKALPQFSMGVEFGLTFIKLRTLLLFSIFLGFILISYVLWMCFSFFCHWKCILIFWGLYLHFLCVYAVPYRSQSNGILNSNNWRIEKAAESFLPRNKVILNAL